MSTLAERERQARWQEKHLRREARLSMVRPSPELRLGLNERLFRANLVMVYLVTVTLAIIDYIRHRLGLPPVLEGQRIWAGIGVAVSLLIMAIAVVDLATYRPRLFTLSSRDCRQFFRKLAEFSVDFDSYLREIRNTPARTWRQIARFQDNLVKEATNVILVDRLRARITVRVLMRLGSLLLGLSLLCYSMSYLGSRDVMIGDVTGGGYIPHLYFTIVTFFTIGFGNVYPSNDLVGYAFVGVTVLMIALVSYFLIAEVLAAQFGFTSNLRKSAQSYILRISVMGLDKGTMELKEQ